MRSTFAGLRRLSASMYACLTPCASVTTTRRLGEWKPWMLWWELEEKAMAKRSSSMTYFVSVILPGSASPAAATAMRSSCQRMSLICRRVGPVTTTLAWGRVWSHQTMARAAAQSLPDELHAATETRGCFARAFKISSCLSYGLPAAPRMSLTKPTGLFL